MPHSKTEILLIDDDVKLAELLTAYLSQFGMHLQSATHPDEGLKKIQKKEPSLVLLDVMLPGRDGFKVCQEIRQKSTVPIIMLTARGETADRVVGLELGADDYLPKPFEPRELVARIQTVLRRSKGRSQNNVLKFGPLEVSLLDRVAKIEGRDVELTSTEFELLSLLVSRPGKKFDRDEIVQHLRGVDSDVFSRSIDILVSRLRAKLGDDPKAPHYIKTAWGTGYVFTVEQIGGEA